MTFVEFMIVFFILKMLYASQDMLYVRRKKNTKEKQVEKSSEKEMKEGSLHVFMSLPA